MQIRYDGLYDVPKDPNTLFVSLHEEHGKLAGEYTELHGTHQELQDRFTLILAQVQTLSDEQRITGQKLAQVESEGTNRGVVQLLNRVEAFNSELNRLRGQIEVLTNDVNNAQKRQRDMYVDLDTRLRRIEQGSSAGKKDQDTIAALEERIRKLEQGSATPATIPQPVPSATAAPVNPPPQSSAATTTAAVQPSAPPANPGYSYPGGRVNFSAARIAFCHRSGSHPACLRQRLQQLSAKRLSRRHSRVRGLPEELPEARAGS